MRMQLDTMKIIIPENVKNLFRKKSFCEEVGKLIYIPAHVTERNQLLCLIIQYYDK